MAQPQVSWWNSINAAQITDWAIGQVDAGSTSPDTTFLIWNNRGGSTGVSDMTSCTITTKDSGGNDTGELVTNKWIHVRVDTMSESTFTPIGGTTTKSIKAGGSAPAGTIKGTANDGTTANATENFAQVTLHAVPLATATAGNVDFLLRVAYTYV
ncbi:hypothetical protein [Paenibacillus naphthalenovorans]|uniref:Uncharacterized protein n=1 Tax=Paenibacillus naphthalenovorans TaxID=162209 RepID=A0A0U2W493_9BACL|nr:hypothetical protein [Paenibacillus naphthalenovorans]ALS22325.1 hypothetical protein IJ22_19510 [Paenibacillus naphthalenovorans]